MSVPLVDIARFASGTQAERRQIAASFDAACRDSGFLVLAGHGVPEDVQANLYQSAKAFFELPLARKLEIRRVRQEQNRGYIPYGEERLVRMHGGDSPPDFKEVFSVGPCAVPDEPYYRCEAAYPNFAPNVWPDKPRELRPAMERYYREMEALSERLVRICALALGLGERWFEGKLDRHTSHLRALHYPAPDRDLAPGQLRCGVHTDLGALTVLRNEAVSGGLEVQGSDGRWLSAPAIENTFVVNIGDLMMRWTNDRWTSTPHRVAVPQAASRSRSRRLSIAYFLRPNYDAEIACIPTCSGPDRPSRYVPTTLARYSVARFTAGADGPNTGEKQL